MHVLITGMSGVGKSTLVGELRERGYAAYDADDDGFAEPRADGRWGWRAAEVAESARRARRIGCCSLPGALKSSPRFRSTTACC